MYADKRDRHKEPYLRHMLAKMKARFPQVKDELVEKLSKRTEKLREKAMAKIKKRKVEQ